MFENIQARWSVSELPQEALRSSHGKICSVLVGLVVTEKKGRKAVATATKCFVLGCPICI